MAISRILQVTVLGLLLLAGSWGVFWWGQDRPALAVAGALGILFCYVPVLMAESFLIWLVNRRDPAPPATLRQYLAGLIGEALQTVAVFYWRQAFRLDAIPDAPAPPGCAGRRGVVLVHGFYCNRAFWNPWLRRLSAEGVPFVAINLEPAFGSIDRYGPVIDAAVRTLERSTGRAPVLVGHSMGGLALRVWMRDHQGDARAHRLITIGSPHRGTWTGRFGRSANVRQMALDSPWLRQLAAQEPASRHRSFTCFWGHCDNVVFPASTATLPGADNRHIEGAAHVQMAFREEVFAELRDWLEPGRTGAASHG